MAKLEFTKQGDSYIAETIVNKTIIFISREKKVDSFTLSNAAHQKVNLLHVIYLQV